jgi:hypothetical protein
MLILCSLLSSAALAGEITVHLETHEAGPAAVTFHDVQDGDTLHVLLPGEDGQPVGWFETRVSYDAETEQVQFDARIHGVERSRRGLRSTWLSSPRVITNDGVEASFEQAASDDSAFLRVSLVSDFSE